MAAQQGVAGGGAHALDGADRWKASGNPSLLRELTRYAEARALVGGVTAIQGASGDYPGKHESLVRKVDLRSFGQHKARSIDLTYTVLASDSPLPKLAELLARYPQTGPLFA